MWVGSPVMGVLKTVLVTRGDRVQQGQVLARLHVGAEATAVEINRIHSASTARIEAERVRPGLGVSSWSRPARS